MSNNPRSQSFPVIQDHLGVGWVKSAHGIRGEVFVHLVAGQADWLANTKALLLRAPSGETKPFSIQIVRPFKEGLLIKFRETPDRNAAELLKGHKVYVAESLLVSKPGEPIFLNQIKNFMLIDAKTGGVLGEITGFSSNGPQDLLEVSFQSREVLVPFVDDFIANIDFDKKQVSMDLPEGLFGDEEE